ncbi:hypothetical protein [Capsulimonas corticalis]|nr:hypothetical protein [Capsulimonas corticalis]
MPWNLLAYAALCVCVPAIWGVIVYWISSKIERRVLSPHSSVSERDGEAPTLPLDYHI